MYKKAVVKKAHFDSQITSAKTLSYIQGVSRDWTPGKFGSVPGPLKT